MVKSGYPSVVVLPDMETPEPTILDFLEKRFPTISRHTWETRMKKGNVHDELDRPISINSPYVPGKRVHYYREVEKEAPIPFTENIIYKDPHLLVVCKPHFLPVIPAGPYVNECLLNRLKRITDNPFLTPVNRIDRETAGLVVFSVQKDTRAIYHDLFMGSRVNKTYEAICVNTRLAQRSEWVVENRIVRGTPFFRMKTENGIPNARTHIHLVKSTKSKIFFRLNPITGKKHQLRLHLSSLGYGILNDRYYPNLLPEKEPDFSNPLQLLAKTLSFKDPFTGKKLEFSSPRTLSKDW
ncbi:MAG: pseudouridine synthase [Proteobacteria bacterium]|nr:pseudouridine synthase [Pseudomonadota bacterium]